MLAVETQIIFERLLLEQGLIDAGQLEELKTQAAKENKSLVAIIAQRGSISPEDLVRLNAKANDVPYANLTQLNVPANVIGLVPKELARYYRAVPFGEYKGRLAVGMLDATNIQAIDFIARKVGQPIAAFMVSEDSINHVLTQYKADVSKEVSSVLGAVKQIKADDTPKVAPKQVQNLVQDAPVTRALNTIMDYAVQSGASDIHVEPREHELKIRFRVDGILLDTMTLPKEVEPALVSRIKILSNLKIDEHRIPQDGQAQIHSHGRDIDLRIAVAPIVHGEQVVIRLLDKDATMLTLEALGFKGRSMRWIVEGIHKPHGMTLSTGPTGSGKSTTLYAVVDAIKSTSINIVTLEDPVEYKMEGINQIQVNTQVGLTFASGLRSILRQDPNVIMVGEIRDNETAELAVQAALTGHTVLSTLHTNSAAGVLPRLLDMGVEPFLVASTVNTIIGQRLVRRVCEKCKQAAQSTPTQTESIIKTLGKLMPAGEQETAALKEDLGYDVLPQAGESAYTLYKGKGCPECTNGYKGRIGIYEVFPMTNTMEKLLAARATTSQIQAQAEADGMVTMKQDGYLKALNGLTTLEEVARVASDF